MLRIDTSEFKKLASKLDKMNRTSFPVAVRSVLNDAAFDLKTKSMPQEADSTFEKRQPNFFKANSKFTPAQGFDIKSMQSAAGFYENKLQNASSNYAVKDLEEQEFGGNIDKKSFIPGKDARKGGKGIVKPNARLSAINRIANRRNAKGSNWGQQMIRSALFVGKGGFVLTEQFEHGKGGALLRIKSIKKVNGKVRFVAEKLYSFKKGRIVHVDATHFMKESSQTTSKKMDEMFLHQAIRQFRKLGIIK